MDNSNQKQLANPNIKAQHRDFKRNQSDRSGSSDGKNHRNHKYHLADRDGTAHSGQPISPISDQIDMDFASVSNEGHEVLDKGIEVDQSLRGPQAVKSMMCTLAISLLRKTKIEIARKVMETTDPVEIYIGHGPFPAKKVRLY